MNAKTIKIIYWISTILFALFMLSTCIPNPEGFAFMTGDGEHELSFPKYFPNFIAVAKVLGVIGILIPGFPRVKEWAYAGLFFDLVSAVYAFIAVGVIADTAIFMITPFVLGITSYVFYHKKLKVTA